MSYIRNYKMMVTVMIKSKICFWSIMFMICYSQRAHSQSAELKTQINELYDSNNIVQINTIINTNPSLDLKYALETLNRNLQLAKSLDDKKDMVDTYIALGNFWHAQGNFVKAYDNYLQAEKISIETGNQRLIGVSMLNRANLSKNINERIRLYQEAIKIFEENHDTLNLTKTHMNLGDAFTNYYWDLKESDSAPDENKSIDIDLYKNSAFNHYESAGQLNRSLKSDVIAGILKIHSAEWYKRNKDYQKADSLFKSAQDILDSGQFPKGNTYSFLQRADIALKLNDFDRAIEMLKQGEKLTEKYEYNDYKVGVNELYVDAYTQKDDFKTALDYYKRYMESVLKKNDLKSEDKLHALDLEYSLLKNELVIEKYEAERKLQITLIIVGAFGFVLAIIILYLMNINKKRRIDNAEKQKVIAEMEKSAYGIKLKNQKLREELLKEKVKFSQDHLIQFANHVDKIENFLEEVKDSLKKVNMLTDNQEIINSLKMSFVQVLNGQNHLKQLSSLTSQLNQDFFFYIRNNYENISEDDEQLLSFILLNLSSKEISRLLNISHESIYKKRYRLRKKLNFDNDESFIDFYNKVVDNLNKS